MRVTLSELGHRFPGGPWLFRHLEIALEPGRVYSLTGPSGTGKSTLLALMAGWLTPAEGTVDKPADVRIVWVFQNPHGTPHRSARDHIALPYLAKGHSPSEADAQADVMLDLFDLRDVGERPFRELSGGEAQRLMLARGHAAEPDLFLIDEPTAQLDRQTATTVNACIGALAKTSAIVVVATHDDDTRDACTHHIRLERRADIRSGG
ncbi:ABC transporter ATP-binding protein [Leifsonia sp. 21MFCrub1.1]|uniref:ABC transporter ATP-binding protein n=1 Tax=Leifsonia sp. 21MFCrub1.1 TaxID=1798223 RepID=UPI0008929EF3|nr:ATP-binding cassette domain-containing protein [Leifsonia sp. 21MFCrub1.1]SEA32946.1 putative ABC transport system ATP-binding protein [Leifsonia sp. 21MFCrub1.1]